MRDATPTPELGMAATIAIGSDAHAGTIVKVNPSATRVTIREDKATVVEGSTHDGSARYEYAPDPEGYEWAVSLRGNGRWVVVGHNKMSRLYAGIGHRRQYRDPSF